MAKKDVIKGFMSQRGWEERGDCPVNAAVAVQLHPTLFAAPRTVARARLHSPFLSLAHGHLQDCKGAHPET